MIFTAIQESKKKGFNGRLTVKTTCPMHTEFFKKIGFTDLELKEKDVSSTLLKLENIIKDSIEDESINNKARRKIFLPVSSFDNQLKVSNILLERLPDNNGELKLTNTGTLNDIIKVNGKIVEKGTSLQVKSFDNIRAGNNLYKSSGDGLRLISEQAETIEALFPHGLTNLNLAQHDKSGDCYLLSSIIALSLCPEGEELIANMIQTTPDFKNITVTFPGFPEDEIIFKDLSEVEKEEIRVSSDSPGVVILEQAFGELRKKYNWSKFPSKDLYERWQWLADGWENDALYALTGGKKFWLDSLENTTNYNPGKSFFSDQTGSFKEEFEKRNVSLDIVEDFLKNISQNKGNYITLAGSGRSFPDEPCCFNLITGNLIPLEKGHAYAVSDINLKERNISLIDPYIPDAEIKIGFDDFYNYFSNISGVETPFEFCTRLT